MKRSRIKFILIAVTMLISIGKNFTAHSLENRAFVKYSKSWTILSIFFLYKKTSFLINFYIASIYKFSNFWIVKKYSEN